MSVRVRRLEAQDKPAWLGLFKGYIEFYKATVARRRDRDARGSG